MIVISWKLWQRIKNHPEECECCGACLAWEVRETKRERFEALLAGPVEGNA